MSKPMTAVVKRYEEIRRGGAVRKECWGATSRDGRWAYERAADEGTHWYVINEPTGWTITGGNGSLGQARNDTATGWALLELWLDAHRELALPEDTTLPVTNHDRARGVLTWLAEHEPAAFDTAVRMAESRRLRELADRLHKVAADLFEQLPYTRQPELPRVRELCSVYTLAAEEARSEAAALLNSVRRQAA